MCLDVRKMCECGAQTVQFHLRDNVMLPEVISRLFCPSCPGGETAFNDNTMLNDNGWILEYDMVLAISLAVAKLQVEPEMVRPGFLFDSGYACWQEMYPGEQAEIKEEREKIIELAQKDQKQYLQTIQKWNIERIKRLKEVGWRRAQNT